MSDRRREPRFSTDQSAVLVLLSEGDLRLPVQVLEISGTGLRLLLNRLVHVDSAVRIDLNDCILLGEVCHCAPAPGGYLCGVQLEQALTNVSDLVRLNEHLMGEQVPERTRG